MPLLAYLRELVKELILIVILAGFIDLLLPSGSTRKFARVVVGLFVIMALFNPLLLLLRQEVSWSPARLENSVFRGEELGRISSQGEALAATAKEQAYAHYRRQLEDQARALVISLEEVSQVQAQAILKEESGRLLGLAIWVKGEEEAGAGVPMVEEIEIRISEGGEAGPRGGGEGALPAALKERIITVLTTFFGIEPEAISVFAWDKGISD